MLAQAFVPAPTARLQCCIHCCIHCAHPQAWHASAHAALLTKTWGGQAAADLLASMAVHSHGDGAQLLALLQRARLSSSMSLHASTSF